MPGKPVDPVLQTLLRKRVEIYTWLDSPVKQAFLAKVNRMIEERLDLIRGRSLTETRSSAASEVRHGPTAAGAQAKRPQTSTPTLS
jgi:hypothetical protein